MAKKRDPKKAEQKEKIMSVAELKEMESIALTIPMKLQNSSFYQMQNVIGQSHALVDQFYQVNKHRMTPRQCEMAKHDFEYFKFLLDLAIHYSEDGDEERML